GVAQGFGEHPLLVLGAGGFDAAGNIPPDGLDLDDVPLVVADGVVLPGDPAPAVNRQRALLKRDPVGRLLDPLQYFTCGREVVRMNQVPVAGADKLLALPAELAAVGVVDEREAVLDVGEDDESALGLDDTPVAFLAAAQLLLGAFTLLDLLH